MNLKQIKQLAAAAAKKAPARNAVRAQKKAEETAARLQAEFETFTGLLCIDSGMNWDGVLGKQFQSAVIAVTLQEGKVVRAVPMAYCHKTYSGQQATAKWKALHTPKYDAIFLRHTALYNEEETCNYSIGRQKASYQIMIHKVREISQDEWVMQATYNAKLNAMVANFGDKKQ